jgi:copper(I)-binding protein
MISRRVLGAALVVAVLPLAAACGAGRDTTMDKERQTPYVANVKAGSLLVTGAMLVPAAATSASATPSASESATPTPSATPSAAGAQAYLVVTIANSGTNPDQLTGVVVQGATVSPSDQSSESLTVPAQQLVRFGNPESGDSGTSLAVSGASEPFTVGTSMQVTFEFRDAGSATLEAPVVPSDQVGSTATSAPLTLTHSYPTPSESAESEPASG